MDTLATSILLVAVFSLGFVVGCVFNARGEQEHDPEYPKKWAAGVNSKYLIIPRWALDKMPYEWLSKLSGLLQALDEEGFKHKENALAVSYRGKGGKFVVVK